jgi:hypothetical protein
MKPESSDTVTRGVRRYRRAVAHHLMDYPTPDYSKIPPKVNCWRTKPIFAGNGEGFLVRNGIVTVSRKGGHCYLHGNEGNK